MPMKKGMLVKKTLNFFKPILILTTLSCYAVSPLVICKSLKRSDKSSRIYSGYNLSSSYNPINSLRKYI